MATSGAHKKASRKSFETMAMRDAHKKALDKSLKALCDDLVVMDAIIHLRAREFLTENDEDAINAKVTEKEKVCEFVKRLKKRGDGGFQTFVEHLKERRGSRHLAQTLESNLQEVTDGLSRLTIQDGKQDMRDAWQLFENKISYIRCAHDSIEDFQHLPKEINLLMIGKTGSGKSATANTILGFRFFQESGGGDSMTKTIVKKQIEESRIKINVIDTPGLFDTDRKISNEDLMLEIAKTAVNFASGIHLFLLVCSHNVRFTKEEEDTIASIEKALTTALYSNCVVVLSNARARFGGKNQLSLRSFVDAERRKGGRFGSLLERVGGRIVAVENQCDDDLFMAMHRQRLLCCLAQIINDNRGNAYSPTLLKNARKRVKREEKERHVRLQREKNLTMMRRNVGIYLVSNYLISLNERQLYDISNTLHRNVHHIMVQSGVQQLDHITATDVLKFLEMFVQENSIMITKLLDKKAQETKQLEQMKLQEEALKKNENINKMQSFVLTYIRDYLSKLPKHELEALMRCKQIPLAVMGDLKTRLAWLAIKVDEHDVERFIQQSFFQNLNEIKLFIEERNRQIQLDRLKYEIMTKIGMDVGGILGTLDEVTLERLRRCLGNMEPLNINEWAPLFLQRLGSTYDNCGLDIRNILYEYLIQNANLLNSHISSNIERLRQEHIRLQRDIREKRENDARENISNVIDSRLKTYLTGKSKAELVSIKNKIDNHEVPNDIYSLIEQDLRPADKEVLSKTQIEEEILIQIRNKQDIINQSLNEASRWLPRWCFSGSCTVQLKGGKRCKISSLEVNDEVLAYNTNGELFYDKVYLFSHASSKQDITYVHIQTHSGKNLFISPGHLLPIGQINQNIPASNVLPGDVLLTVQNDEVEPDIVTIVSHEQCDGAYCPLTTSGTVIVNGVIASCYTTVISHRMAHALLSPIRTMFNLLPLTIYNALFPYDHVEGTPLLFSVCRSIITKWRSTMDHLGIKRLL